jgi:cytochrome c peroxidase
MIIPVDNPMTEEGVELGKRLFYDPILSADNSQSCASCHIQASSFTDNRRFSVGIDGEEGFRNAMSLINAGWLGELNWDGSAGILETQAFEPVTNPVEMHNTWPQAVNDLKNDPDYPELFFKAFGTYDIDSTHVSKAIAQFERTLISSNSRWDRYLRGEVQLSLAETRGFEIFFTEKGDCFHCHSTILFTDNDFHNNGLDSIFTDTGLNRVTGDPNDIGRFRTPTLRNVELTGPYMHDGRFESLEEVIDFYSEGVKFSPTIDPLMKNVDQGGVRLTRQEKNDLIAYIKTLTDTTFVTNPEYSNPFQND